MLCRVPCLRPQIRTMLDVAVNPDIQRQHGFEFGRVAENMEFVVNFDVVGHSCLRYENLAPVDFNCSILFKYSASVSNLCMMFVP